MSSAEDKENGDTNDEIGPPKAVHFKGKSKGILINNWFKGQGPGKELSGYNHDEARILKTFGELNVEFHVERCLKKSHILTKISRWFAMTDFDDVDCVICVLCSRGKDDGLIIGDDGATVHFDEIKSLFINFKELEGKPKLFFVQACKSGVTSEPVEVDDTRVASSVKKVKDADVFQFFPTAPGHAAWVDPDGSIFLKTLCNVLQTYGGKFHLQDIVTKVNELLAHEITRWRERTKIFFSKKVASCEASETTHTMTCNIFFNDSKPDSQI